MLKLHARYFFLVKIVNQSYCQRHAQNPIKYHDDTLNENSLRLKAGNQFCKKSLVVRLCSVIVKIF